MVSPKSGALKFITIVNLMSTLFTLTPLHIYNDVLVRYSIVTSVDKESVEYFNDIFRHISCIGICHIINNLYLIIHAKTLLRHDHRVNLTGLQQTWEKNIRTRRVIPFTISVCHMKDLVKSFQLIQEFC